MLVSVDRAAIDLVRFQEELLQRYRELLDLAAQRSGTDARPDGGPEAGMDEVPGDSPRPSDEPALVMAPRASSCPSLSSKVAGGEPEPDPAQPTRHTSRVSVHPYRSHPVKMGSPKPLLSLDAVGQRHR